MLVNDLQISKRKQLMFWTLSLLLFILFSTDHLVYSWRDNQKRRAFTKPFLLVFLVLYYLACARQIYIPLILALLTSWLGDVLLIPKGHKWFTAGGIAFMLSHLFFILVYLQKIELSQQPWQIIIPVAMLYYGIALKIIYSLKGNTPKMMLFPMYFYLLCNSTMNIFALMQLCSDRSIGALTAYIGAVLFYISDCTLFLVRYHPNKELVFKKHFTVMITYLLGEFLITYGILLI